MSYFDQLVQRSGGSQLFDYHPNGHVQRCQCGQAVFFDNQFCLRCGSALAYHPEQGMLCSIEQEPNSDQWVIRSEGPLAGRSYRLCQHRNSAAQCNWMVSKEETAPFCVACSLNLTIPDLSIARNADYWLTTEQAKRRLIAQLIMLGLPTVSKQLDAEQGLGFKLLRQQADGPAVLTGHMNGVITLNIEEADPAHRETVKQNMHEPYRTMLGHFRHESGHYYWDRLVRNTPWLPVFRQLFGDERLDYQQALEKHYYQGPPVDWYHTFISSYAASHPWEDWAETWAHYLHMTDTLNVALDFGIRLDTLKLHIDEFERSQLLGCPRGNDDQDAFLAFINRWVQLSSVLNVLARSMGQPDIYPFVLTTPSLRKLYLVHSVVADVG